MTHKQQVNAALQRYAACLKATRRLHALGVPSADVVVLFRVASERARDDLAALVGTPSVDTGAGQ